MLSCDWRPTFVPRLVVAKLNCEKIKWADIFWSDTKSTFSRFKTSLAESALAVNHFKAKCISELQLAKLFSCRENKTRTEILLFLEGRKFGNLNFYQDSSKTKIKLCVLIIEDQTISYPTT